MKTTLSKTQTILIGLVFAGLMLAMLYFEITK